MLKWWRDIRRFDKALSWILGLFGCLVSFVAGLSILVRSDEASNMILGGFLLVLSGSIGWYYWHKVRGLRGRGRENTTITCPSCQLEFRLNEEQSKEPMNCPQCGRIIDD